LSNPNDQPLSHDLLTGADEIADYLGWPVRQTYHAVSQGHIPTFKIGPKIMARKSELRARCSGSYKANGGAQ
jgi:hypothetical protein